MLKRSVWRALKIRVVLELYNEATIAARAYKRFLLSMVKTCYLKKKAKKSFEMKSMFLAAWHRQEAKQPLQLKQFQNIWREGWFYIVVTIISKINWRETIYSTVGHSAKLYKNSTKEKLILEVFEKWLRSRCCSRCPTERLIRIFIVQG